MALRKLDDIVIYRDDRWYSTFPSLIRLADGRLLCGFRRAPERRLQPGGSVSHTDPNSQAMCVLSADEGATWEAEPRLIYAHPAAGCQDPCLHLLRDGTIICSLFAWQLFPLGFAQKMQGPHVVRQGEAHGWPMANVGVHVLRSADEGATWSQPLLLDYPAGSTRAPVGTVSRGAARGGGVQLDDGAFLLPVYREPSGSDVFRSTDGGRSFAHLATIAADEQVAFEEPHLHLCPSGKVMAFLRTAGLEGYLAYSWSTDGGASWAPWQRSDVWGHPFTTATCSDGRVLLAYGYRREPFGIRCTLLDPECERVDVSGELVLRDDLGNGDIGYPWAVALPDGRVLVAYYANIKDGTRYLAGSFVAVD
ncbi:MAG: sialidase family protein [Armatimonadota bacterium]